MKSLIVFILILTGAYSFAQSNHYKLDLIGGLSPAKMPDSTSFGTANYFHFGVNNYFQIGKKFNLNASVLFSRKGAKRLTPFRKYQFNNIDLVLFHQITLVDDLYLDLGFRASYLINARNVSLSGSSGSGTLADNFTPLSVLNAGYQLGLTTRLQDKASIYLRFDRSVQFSHEDFLFQEFRIGFTYLLADIRWLKDEKSKE